MAFDRKHRSLLLGVAVVTGSGLVAALVAVPAAQATTPSSPTSTVAELAVLGAQGAPELVTAPVGRPLARPDGVPSAASDATVARAHLVDVAPLFGVDADPTSLRTTGSTESPGVGSVVRFGQLVDGVPVYGGELVVSLDESGGLLSVGGDTVPDTELDFPVPAAKAAAVALEAAAAKLKLPARVLTTTTPRKLAYDPTLVGDTGSGVSAVWRVVVAGPRGSSAKADVLVDATDASVVSLTGATEAIQRAVCDAGSGGGAWNTQAAYAWCGSQDDPQIYRDTNNDGYVVTNSYVSSYYGIPMDSVEQFTVDFSRVEGDAAGSDADTDLLYDRLGLVSDFYDDVLGVDVTSWIGAQDKDIGRGSGTTRRLGGIANYCAPVEAYYGYLEQPVSDYRGEAGYYASVDCGAGYANAFWSDADYYWMKGDGPFPGGQVSIGEGMSASEDVIGHELTHGVTSATSALIYKNESGAINESMSDVFGQLVQEYAAPGTDTGWLIGDKLDGPALNGAIRSMSNPTRTDLPEGDQYGQPDAMTSPKWDTDPYGYDAGGVHTNSGVGNKAAWLIAHGGTFNGVTVARLDRLSAPDSLQATEKMAKLYWEVQQQLPSNANYRRLALTLTTACNKLVGTSGFVAQDCAGSVAAAAAATRMTESRTTLSATASSVKSGKTVQFTARVADARNGGVGGVTVKLQRKVRGTSTWSTVGSGMTGLSNATYGKKYWTVKPTRSAYYRVVYSGGGIWKGATSSIKYVALKPTISKSVSRTRFTLKKSFKVTGKVGPTLKGKTVLLQRYSGGKWRTVKKDKLSSGSRYSLAYKPKSRADRNFRVYLPAASAYGSATSSKFRITVK